MKEEGRMKGMKDVRDGLHHHLNSLHVYCRLVRIMPERLARKVASRWEKSTIYILLYRTI